MQTAGRDRRRRQRSIFVGVDFGTSTTKVVWHDTSEDSFEVFQWNKAANGIQSYLFPSTISVRDDGIHFGLDECKTGGTGVHIPWIKICVLCESNPKICRRCEHSRERGKVRLNDRTIVSARALACLFLSHVIGIVEKTLTARFRDETLQFQWNVGCPIDHLDRFGARESYEAMVQLAWDRRATSADPVVIGDACAVEAQLRGMQLAPDADRLVHVRPETHAGVMAFLQSPHAEEKTYVLVDVGAGTTDVSMFIHGRRRAENEKPFVSSYLGDGSFPIGGGDIDRELAEAWGLGIDEAKRRKEAGGSTPTLASAEIVFRGYQSICCQVVERRMLTSPSDMVFDLFLFGGGGRVPSINAALRKPLPRPLRLNRLEGVKPPKNLRRIPDLDRNFDLLALACGLASTVLDWDRIDPPSRTPPMPERSPAPRRSRPDRDELYPK
jgi:Ethanolamine utilization protein EutJ (predicted chaperonin)